MDKTVQPIEAQLNWKQWRNVMYKILQVSWE